MSLDRAMKRFRLASRELFNNYFYVDGPKDNTNPIWQLRECFSPVENELFNSLIAAYGPEFSYTEATPFRLMPYRALQPSIRVELTGEFAPIMINREVKSGYWDHPLKEARNEAVLLFLEFFDWDGLSYSDNEYVRVQIDSWPSHPEVVGKHALILSNYVQFTRYQNQEREAEPKKTEMGFKVGEKAGK